MKHLPARTCGYQGRTCVGVQFSFIQNKISCEGYQNFYRLPRKFTSVVPQTQFIAIDDEIKNSFELCTTSYQPFQQGGFFDAFGVLSSLLPAYQCYASDSTQKPGILLPTPQLNPFQPVSALAVPTAAISPINNIKKAINNIRQGVKSGCSQGLIIFCDGKKHNGKKTGRSDANKFNFYVSKGTVSISYPGGGFTLKIDDLYANSQHETTIFIVVQQDITQSNPTFKGKLVYDEDMTKYMGKAHTWVIQIGTIKIQSAIVDVVQTLCSPIQLKIDWVRPDQTDQAFVWTWKSKADEPQWMPVKDCG